MTARKLNVRVGQLRLHSDTLNILESCYPKRPKDAEQTLTLEEAVQWTALDAWIRYREHLMYVGRRYE